MKCIRCGHDSKYKERSDRRCPGCHKEFAFEPQKGDLLTDPAFQAAIEAVSASDRVRWGVEHLYYEVCRRRRKRGLGKGWLVLIVVVLVAVWLSVGWTRALVPGVILGLMLTLFVGGLLATIAPGVFRGSVPPTVSPGLDTFNTMWARWGEVHGTPKGVIARQTPAPRKRPVESDLGDYSFDRAVICDRARTVDLLLANNFHFENNCAVLSIGGYPQGPFETVRAMLKKNPRLHVFALHDATVPGCKLAHQLTTDPSWFKDQVPVTDVGLRPSHAGPFRGLLLPAPSGPVPADGGLAKDEADWLSRYTLELAAIRPEQVLKRLFRAINRKGDDDRDRDEADDAVVGVSGVEPGGRGHAGVAYDRESFGTDAADGDGGPDSFG